MTERPNKFSRLPVPERNVSAKGKVQWCGLRHKCLLFLPAAGNRGNSTGTLFNRGSNGNYWSSTENGTDNAWNLNFNSGGANMNNNNRTNGLSVRCVAEFIIDLKEGDVSNVPFYFY